MRRDDDDDIDTFKTNVSSRLATAVWSGAGLILASVGIWTGSTLQALSVSVSGLQHSVGLLEQKLVGLPPAELLLRVKILEEHYSREIVQELQRQQTQIDRIENMLPDIKKQNLGKYIE